MFVVNWYFATLQAKRLERKEHEDPIVSTVQEPVRSSLAVLSVQNKPRQQQSSTAGGFALARPKRKATSNPGKENAGGLDIFVDDEFKPGNPESGAPSAAPVAGLWTKLGGFEQNRQAWWQTHALLACACCSKLVPAANCLSTFLPAGRRMCRRHPSGLTSGLHRKAVWYSLPFLC